MLVVNRFVVSDRDAAGFRADLETAHRVLSERPGYLQGQIGRNLDDPSLWVMTTSWEHVGAYRRALSSYEVKMHGVPLLSRAVEEPSAFEPVEPGADLNVWDTRR